MKCLSVVYLSAVNVCGFASCAERTERHKKTLDRWIIVFTARSNNHLLDRGSFDTFSLSHDTSCTVLQVGHG